MDLLLIVVLGHGCIDCCHRYVLQIKFSFSTRYMYMYYCCSIHSTLNGEYVIAIVIRALLLPQNLEMPVDCSAWLYTVNSPYFVQLVQTCVLCFPCRARADRRLDGVIGGAQQWDTSGWHRQVSCPPPPLPRHQYCKLWWALRFQLGSCVL